MKIKALFLLVLTLASAAIVAQGTFTVTGTAVKNANADELIITAGITLEGGDASKLFTESQQVISEAITYLKTKRGVKETETELINLQYNRYAKTAGNAFISSQTLRVTLEDFTLYDEVMLTLVEMGFNTIGNVQFALSNAGEMKNSLQIEAIREAKRKAEVFSKELGVELAGVVSFSEQNYQVAPMRVANTYSMDAKGGAGPSVAPSQVKISMGVIVSYAIKSKTE
jgi:uncharacterized protein YggE